MSVRFNIEGHIPNEKVLYELFRQHSDKILNYDLLIESEHMTDSQGMLVIVDESATDLITWLAIQGFSTL